MAWPAVLAKLTRPLSIEPIAVTTDLAAVRKPTATVLANSFGPPAACIVASIHSLIETVAASIVGANSPTARLKMLVI